MYAYPTIPVGLITEVIVAGLVHRLTGIQVETRAKNMATALVNLRVLLASKMVINGHRRDFTQAVFVEFDRAYMDRAYLEGDDVAIAMTSLWMPLGSAEVLFELHNELMAQAWRDAVEHERLVKEIGFGED